MHQFFADYAERLRFLHDELHTAIAGLNAAGLDWSPGAGMNSIGVLCAHVAGSERYWVGEVAGGQPAGRDRDSEFRTEGEPVADLKRRLDAALALSEEVLASLQPADLTRIYHDTARDRRFTVGWALLHAVEHTGTHVGHIHITRQMWEQLNGGTGG